jgi:hypothetical protein
MLGGFGKISQIDIEGSSKFLKALFKVNRLIKSLQEKWLTGVKNISMNIDVVRGKSIGREAEPPVS